MGQTIRVAAIQTKRRTISYKVNTPAEALNEVQKNLDELAALAERAAEMGCQIAAFPEDTLGALEWEAGHWEEVSELLRPAQEQMLVRFGEVAAKHGMHIICCNDCVEFEALSEHFGTLWIGRASRERLEKIRARRQ